MTQLQREVAQYQEAQYAPATAKAIRTARRAYTAFCQEYGQWPEPSTGITDAQLNCFVALLARRVKYATILNYVSLGVRTFHEEYGIPWAPTATRYTCRATLKGIRRLKGDVKSQKLPITTEILRKIHSKLDHTAPNDILFWAAATISFFALLRKGQVAATTRTGAAADTHLLQRSDISRCKEARTWITLRHTKTVQYRERIINIPLPHISGSRLCPTAALKRYLSVSSEARGILFQEYSASSATWVPYTYTHFIHRLRTCLSTIGIDPSAYAGHSFRRGGATNALLAGISIPAIKALGDWSSDAYLQYLDINTRLRTEAADKIVHAVRQGDRRRPADDRSSHHRHAMRPPRARPTTPRRARR